MKKALCNNKRQQRGVTLIEALIGVLLMAVVGLGLCYALSKGMLSQRTLNTQNVVISQTREWLLTSDETVLSSACNGTGSGPTLTIGDASTTLVLSCNSGSVVIGTDDLNVTLADGSLATSFSVATPSTNVTKAMFGGQGVIEVSL